MRGLVLVLALAAPAAAGSIEEVRQAEIAFAKAFADRDEARFAAFLADDATFLSAGRTLRGKAAVVSGWSGLLKAPQAPFTWGPERIVVSDDATLALSTGPIYDVEGQPAGSFISTWRKESDGTWKVAFDGPGAPPWPPAALDVEEGTVTAADGVRLHYRKMGRGPLTLIVPLGSILFEQVRQLAGMATVITYDVRNRPGDRPRALRR